MKIVNLTLPLIIEEIENILEMSPHSNSCKALATSKLRQELIDYVLSRIPSIYSVLEDRHSAVCNTESFSCYSNQRRHIQSMIHMGICDILHPKNYEVITTLFIKPLT
jgi:hypothetical protein